MFLFLSVLLLTAKELVANDGTIACDPEQRPVEIRTEGTVISQLGYNGTAPYQPDMTCEYRFIGQPGQNVMLEFTDFLLEECTDCNCDYVEIYAGRDDEAPLVDKICGSKSTPFMLHGGQDAFLRFVSDSSTQGTGFQATFSLGNPACEGGIVIKDGHGIITSPNYPELYPLSTDCTWTFEVPDSSYFVNLQFDDCSIENCGTFLYDSLELTELDTGNRLAVWFGDCPNDPDFTFSNYVGGSSVQLKFHSDISIRSTGFNLTYDFVQRA